MTWKLEESTSADRIVLLARKTETMESRNYTTIVFPTWLEQLTGSKRYAKERLAAIREIESRCDDYNLDEKVEKWQRRVPSLPDKPFICGKCKNDSWKLIARRWNTGYFLQFHCAACGHSDNIISYESLVSGIEKLVDMDMLPAGSMYDPNTKYFSSRDKEDEVEQ